MLPGGIVAGLRIHNHACVGTVEHLERSPEIVHSIDDLRGVLQRIENGPWFDARSRSPIAYGSVDSVACKRLLT